MKFWPLPHARLWAHWCWALPDRLRQHAKATTSWRPRCKPLARPNGIPGAALSRLEASATTADEKAALLYNLERGELLRMDRRYDDSTGAFLLADTKVKEWEETAQTNPSKLMGTVGAALISERLKVHEGQDYEKSG